MIVWSIVAAAIAGLAFATTAPVSAQEYPSKPIKVIVPYSAGGPSDVIARLITQRMTPIVGQSFILENRGGAVASLGGRAVANSDPDGYTILFVNTGSLVLSPIVFKPPDYDPSKTL